jgi:hypothetical protein
MDRVIERAILLIFLALFAYVGVNWIVPRVGEQLKARMLTASYPERR